MNTWRPFIVGALLLGACSEKPRGSADAAPTVDAASPLPANARAALANVTDPSIVAAQNVVRRDMSNLAAWIALGHSWQERARATNELTFHVNADACASVVLAKDPDHVAAADLRGVALRARHEYGEARQLAERITVKHPSETTGWTALTDALLELGHYDAANDAAQKAGHARMAKVQWITGNVAPAKESIRRAKEDDVEAILESATIAWHEGDYARADASFDEALERDSDLAAALAGKGRVAMARGDFSRAVELLRRSYEVRPTVERAWLLGDAREASGDPKGAAEAYALVTKHAATDPRAYSLFLSARKDRTKEQYSDALRLASEVHVKQQDVYTEDALAWALYRAGMPETAKTAMGRARRFHTPDARILFHEGAIRIAGGDVKKGKEVIAQALEMNPAFDWRGAKEARELLAR